MMRRVATILALALSVLGCSIFQPPVKLLTYTELGVWLCCIPHIQGTLLPDPEVGTVLKVEDDGRLEPISWPAGYTGRLAGSEVEILNERGEVVARTGQTYVCSQSANSPRFWYGCEEVPIGPEPTPQFDLAAVQARFAAACQDPSVLKVETCDLIDIDGMQARGDNLFVPMTLAKMNGVRGQRICEQIAAVHDDLGGEPLGFRIVVLEGLTGKHLGVCDVP